MLRSLPENLAPARSGRCPTPTALSLQWRPLPTSALCILALRAPRPMLSLASAQHRHAAIILQSPCIRAADTKLSVSRCLRSCAQVGRREGFPAGPWPFVLARRLSCHAAAPEAALRYSSALHCVGWGRPGLIFPGHAQCAAVAGTAPTGVEEEQIGGLCDCVLRRLCLCLCLHCTCTCTVRCRTD